MSVLNEVLELTQFYIDKQKETLNINANFQSTYKKCDNGNYLISVCVLLKKNEVTKMYYQPLFIINGAIEDKYNLNMFLSKEQKELTNQLIENFIRKIKEKTGGKK